MFLTNWKQYKVGFRFKQLYPKKEPFISAGVAGKPHLGIDILTPIGTPLIAPFDCNVAYVKGTQGGHQAYIRRPGRVELFRLLHLNVPPQTGDIKKGQQFGVTGNSGSATNTPHLHLDISKNGKIELNNINNFLNPEDYNFQTPMKEIKIPVVLFANKSNWPSLQTKLDMVRDWFKTNSKTGYQILLEFKVEHTNFDTIPFMVGEQITMTDYTDPNNPKPYTVNRRRVDDEWYNQNISLKTQGNAIDALLVNAELWPSDAYAGGYRTDDEQGAVEIQLTARENAIEDGAFGVPRDEFFGRLSHEIWHALLMLTGQDNVGGVNTTHQYRDQKNMEGLFGVINYEALITMVQLKLSKGDDMSKVEFVHVADTAEYGFLETTAFSKIYHRGVNEADIKFQAVKFGLNVANPDGAINFGLARRISL